MVCLPGVKPKLRQFIVGSLLRSISFYENCYLVMIIMTIKLHLRYLYFLVSSFYCLAYNKYTIYDN